MNIKTYEFEYQMEAEVTFEVDLDVFTPEMAKATLDFFSWDDAVDEDADPIDEVMKKYAMRAIKAGAYNNLSEFGVKREFEEMEGFCRVDGSIGITLTYFSGHEFNMSDLEVAIS